MVRLTKLNTHERLLVESPVNRFKLAGPGWVLLTPRQRILARVYVGPKAQSFQFNDVRTAEGVSMSITVQTIYRADPELFTNDLLARTVGLNDGGWQGALRWQTEYVLRLLVAQHPWRELAREEVQKRLERQLTQTLTDRLKVIGLDVFTACLVKTELPAGLQKTLNQAEQDSVEAGGRARVLKNYFEIFGDSLSRAMPYIIQWELMNTVHKNGDPKILLTGDNLSSTPSLPANGVSRLPVLHMQLPMQ